MVSKLTIGLALTCILATVQAYSGGAPEDVCEDMTPKHPAQPQRSKIPYTIKVNSNSVQAGQVVKITISGSEGFKGFLLQVRQGSKNVPVGEFVVDGKDKYVKTINCGQGQQNAATHKNSEIKNNLTVDWKVPSSLKGDVQVFVTVAKDGGTYWVAQPTAVIKVN